MALSEGEREKLEAFEAGGKEAKKNTERSAFFTKTSAAQKKREEELEAQRKAAQAKQDATLKKQAAAFKKAQLAAEKAHAAAEKERKAKEAQQIAAHKKQMADRRAKFESKFRNVWATGATGVSYMQMTTSDDPNTLIAKLFKGTMIADDWNVVSSVKRSFNKNGAII